MGKENKEGLVTWFQLKNALPFIGLLATIILSFAALRSDIRSGAQRQETTDTNVADMKQDIKEIKNTTVSMGKDIVELKTLLRVQASNRGNAVAPSTIASIASPTPTQPQIAAPQQQRQTVFVEAKPTPVPSPMPVPTTTPTPAPPITPIVPLKDILPPIVGLPIIGLLVKRGLP